MLDTDPLMQWEMNLPRFKCVYKIRSVTQARMEQLQGVSKLCDLLRAHETAVTQCLHSCPPPRLALHPSTAHSLALSLPHDPQQLEVRHTARDTSNYSPGANSGGNSNKRQSSQARRRWTRHTRHACSPGIVRWQSMWQRATGRNIAVLGRGRHGQASPLSQCCLSAQDCHFRRKRVAPREQR